MEMGHTSPRTVLVLLQYRLDRRHRCHNQRHHAGHMHRFARMTTRDATIISTVVLLKLSNSQFCAISPRHWVWQPTRSAKVTRPAAVAGKIEGEVFQWSLVAETETGAYV